VPRGLPLADSPLVTAAKKAPPSKPEDYVNVFPFAITAEDLKRGQERYTIFCSVCHGPVGDGNGTIVERGYLKVPSYHSGSSGAFHRRGYKVRLRDAPVGHYFEVISQGYGGMPDYAAQIPPGDRWRIIAYIRALQLSQRAVLADLPAGEREAALKALKSAEEKP
jgi:mono/diheme cytochrome c family protein